MSIVSWCSNQCFSHLLFITQGKLIAFVLWLLQIVSSEPISFDAVENSSPSFVSIFSPRMDFDQWKPLTGRGDPLRNDPTYDYEPPVLERVHYWADETRLEREHYPERKSEVLMLGVSSRKPSIASRPPGPTRIHQRPPPSKYEDFVYKFSDHYPMTILVPPPPPPPGHKPPLYIVTEDKLPLPTKSIKVTDPIQDPRETTTTSNLVTSYALQEANLIYQSSTTNQNWLFNYNQTKALPSKAISSDYAGWGPTTPFKQDGNDTYNLIFSDKRKELNKEPYSFYKPMLSESPPPRGTPAPVVVPTFAPTVPPPTDSTTSIVQITIPYEETTISTSADTQSYYEDVTTEKNSAYTFLPTPAPNVNTKPNVVDMLSSMISMPMIPDADRPEDNLYAHASETVHIFKDYSTTDDVMKLEVLQTMLPPPFSKTESTTHRQPVHVNPHTANHIHDKPGTITHDPYLHMRYTTPTPTVSVTKVSQDMRTTTEVPALPMYLIIQGHSKVKTYSSKNKATNSLNNEIPRGNETNEVKHLHPIKQKHSKQLEKIDVHRAGRAKNLKSLVDNGLGSIEIQEADIGIKYDVSDGSGVPAEIYRKGIVDSDENNYSSNNKPSTSENRSKRQIDIEDLLPFDEDTLEEYVYNFFNSQRNETGLTGMIAHVITNDSVNVDDDLENDNSENEER